MVTRDSELLQPFDSIGAGGGSRTPTRVTPRQILSLVRLPIPPPRRREWPVELIEFEAARGPEFERRTARTRESTSSRT